MRHRPLRRGLKRLVSLATCGALLGALITVGSSVTPQLSDAPAQAAPPASAFDPGLIISDSVMFDFGAMSLDRVQSFLDSKVPVCSPTATAPCLKSYRTDIRSVAAVANRCTGDIVGAANQSAAQVIVTVARACGVNPKVLLVTLQKEQGLVTDTSPTAGDYRIAMGYGCPDTAPCDSQYFGFFNQVYQAAYAYNKYVKSPDQYTAYQPGVRQIGYNPKASCGKATVTVKTKATAALYFYTPYVPNAAALANPYRTGDACSSYGNRNFWNYFNDWFGSPISGGFIVRADSGATFVLAGSVKWEIPAARLGILPTLAPLGAVGTVSNAYADSFPTAGGFGNLVTDASGALWLLDNGRRYSIADCGTAASLGFACGRQALLTADMIAQFPLAGPLGSTVQTTVGATYLLGPGSRREVLDATSAQAAGVALGPSSSVLEDTISTIPVAAPIARANVLIQARGVDGYLYSTATGTYAMSAAFVKEAQVMARTGAPVGALDAASLGWLPARSDFAGLFVEADGTAYVLTKTGKAVVTNPGRWGGTFVPLDQGFAAVLASNGRRLTAPLFVKDQATRTSYLLASGTRRPAVSAASRSALAKRFGTSAATTALASDTVFASGRAFVKPGTVVATSAKATSRWFIDGAYKKRSVSAEQARELIGTAPVRVVPATTIAGFATVKGAARPGLTSQGVHYIADGGILRPVSASDKKRYGSRFGFGSYDPSTIAALRVGAPIGRVIKVGSRFFEVMNGKKVVISRAAARTLRASTGRSIQTLRAYPGSLLVTKG